MPYPSLLLIFVRNLFDLFILMINERVFLLLIFFIFHLLVINFVEAHDTIVLADCQRARAYNQSIYLGVLSQVDLVD